jgi:hypothetical protein
MAQTVDMKARDKWLAVLLGVAFLVGGWVWLAPPREPICEGKPLSYWLQDDDRRVVVGSGPILYYRTRASPDRNPRKTGSPWTDYVRLTNEACQAINRTGAQAVPTLLRMLRANDSSLKMKLLQLAAKQSIIKIQFTPAEVLHRRAQTGFFVLGAAASNAVPDLIQLCDRNLSPSRRLGAVDALGCIGPPASSAVPALVRVAGSPSVAERRAAL